MILPYLKSLIKAIPAVLLLAQPLFGQDDDPEAMRADAHATIMRRLSASGKAKTASLGLPLASVAFIDLYLDLFRNKEDIRNRRAPKSRFFMGTPHPQTAMEKDGLKFSACFANFVIDEAVLPFGEAVRVIDAAISPGFAAAVSIETDAKGKIDLWRMDLASSIMHFLFDRDGTAKNAAVKVESWPAFRKKVVDSLLASVPGMIAGNLYPVLLCISTYGDDETAGELIRIRDGLPEGTEGYIAGMFTNCICRIPCETTKAMIARVLDSDDDSAKSDVLSAIEFDPGDEITARIGAFFKNTDEEFRMLRLSAIHGLSGIKSAKAIEILKSALKNPASPTEELSCAMALVNLDQEEAVPVLRKKLAELEADKNRAYMAKRVKDALEGFEKRKKK